MLGSKCKALGTVRVWYKVALHYFYLQAFRDEFANELLRTLIFDVTFAQITGNLILKPAESAP